MDILIIGGTGFIGYHAALAFNQRGYQVSVLGLPPLPTEGLLPPEIKIYLGDLNKISDLDILSILRNKKAVVFAAGSDDRVVPKTPSYPYFYNANVYPLQRLIPLAKKSGVKRGVVIGSYFTHFERIWPTLKLKEHHPYIRSRVDQVNIIKQATDQNLALMVLELPYVFGTIPGRLPLWAPLIRYLLSPFPLFYPRGGTNMISVQHVAEAVVGAIEQGQGGETYLVGDENLTYKDLLNRLMKFTGKQKTVITLPDWITRLGTVSVKIYHRLSCKESGLDPSLFTSILTSETYFDPTPSRQALGYGQGQLNQALKNTVIACLNED